MSNMRVLILAGGGGTRLWPLSREKKPKQFQKIIGDTTLLRQTYENVRSRFSDDDIFVATGAAFADAVAAEIPEIARDHIIVEPARRDNAAAIGYATMRIAEDDPNATIAVVSSDHAIGNPDGYCAALVAAGDAVRAQPDHLVLLGMTPTYAETGYGYIKTGSPVLNFKFQIHALSEVEGSNDKLFHVDSFTEKPSLEKAEDYVASGEYLWNAGIFIFRADTLLHWYAEHLPETHALLAQMRALPKQTPELFAAITPISIDYGIIEKIDRRLVIPADIGWSDVGHWRTVHALHATGDADTIAKTPHVGIDSHGNYIESTGKKLVTTIGVHDMIIVETDDAILICPRNRAHEVKQIVEKLDTKFR